jgi:hypothetical protein
MTQAATDVDIVVGNYAKVPECFYIPENAVFNPPAFEFEAYQKTIDFVKSIGNVALVVIWGKFIRRSLLKGIRFRTDIYPHEDVEFMLRLYAKISSAAITPNLSVYYRQSDTSIISKRERNNSSDVVKVLASFADFTENKENGSGKYLGYIKYYSFTFIRIYLTSLFRKIKNKPEEKTRFMQQLRYVAKAMRRLSPRLFGDLGMSRKHRIGLWLFSHGFVKLGGKMLFWKELPTSDE